MEYYVYIIRSLKDSSYYKGYSIQPHFRLEEHNLGLSKYTSLKRPWVLVHLEVFALKSAALKREKHLKKYSNEQIQRLITSPKNLL